MLVHKSHDESQLPSQILRFTVMSEWSTIECHQMCSNTVGSYECGCNMEFTYFYNNNFANISVYSSGCVMFQHKCFKPCAMPFNVSVHVTLSASSCVDMMYIGRLKIFSL